jgi:hypothetical protein
LVPGEALTWRGNKLFVAVVQDGKVRLQQVLAGDDSGRVVQILTGLQGGETVILNPSPELSNGDAVQVAQPPPQKTSPGAPTVQVAGPATATTPGAGLPAAR